MPNTKPWWMVCPQCGAREKQRDRKKAEKKADYHNDIHHKGTMLAFAEQSEN